MKCPLRVRTINLSKACAIYFADMQTFVISTCSLTVSMPGKIAVQESKMTICHAMRQFVIRFNHLPKGQPLQSTLRSRTTSCQNTPQFASLPNRSTWRAQPPSDRLSRHLTTCSLAVKSSFQIFSYIANAFWRWSAFSIEHQSTKSTLTN